MKYLTAAVRAMWEVMIPRLNAVMTMYDMKLRDA